MLWLTLFSVKSHHKKKLRGGPLRSTYPSLDITLKTLRTTTLSAQNMSLLVQIILNNHRIFSYIRIANISKNLI